MILCTQLLSLSHSFTTHIASDHNVKADCVCFMESPKFSPIRCFEIFGEPAFKGEERNVTVKGPKHCRISVKCGDST